MNEVKLKRIGRKMSFLLRHNPEDLKMDSEGWIKVTDLLKKLSISKEELDWIVDNNDKKRFSYDQFKHKIRASQGHSLSVNVDMKLATDIDKLYHGTSPLLIKDILEKGLLPMSRQHVHLSKDIETATIVGKRKGNSIVILEVDSKSMQQDGVDIWISDNGVYLTKYVDPKYIKLYEFK
jgi:putative RNA 2'-phosphotransferase